MKKNDDFVLSEKRLTDLDENANPYYSEYWIKEFIRRLKEEIRGIPIKDGFQNTIEIHKRIDALAGEDVVIAVNG